MPITRPSADLRNHYKEMSEMCKEANEPIYITVNGKEDTALVSASLMDELYQTIELMQEINRGLSDVVAGRTMTFEEAKAKLL